MEQINETLNYYLPYFIAVVFWSIGLIRKSAAAVIVACHFSIFAFIWGFDLSFTGAAYFVFAGVVDFFTIIILCNYRGGFKPAIAFFIMLLYNCVTFIEFYSNYSYFYNLYDFIMWSMVLILAILSMSSGGYVGNNSRERNINFNSRGGSFSARGLL